MLTRRKFMQACLAVGVKILSTPFSNSRLPLHNSIRPRGWRRFLSGMHYPHLRDIYAAGLIAGNQPNVFGKLGGSTTESVEYLYHFGTSPIEYSLGDFAYLEPTITYYRGGSVPLRRPSSNATPSNSFMRLSYGGRNGLIIDQVMNVLISGQYPYYTQCSGKTNADCEFDEVNPCICLLWFGVNEPLESPSWTTERFKTAYAGLIEYCLSRSIIPVIGTVGKNCYNLFGNDGTCYDELVAEYNTAIRQLSKEYEIPHIDYSRAFAELPNAGMSPDNLHPSSPTPVNLTATLTQPYLRQYGYNVRNLLSLLMLHELRGILE